MSAGSARGSSRLWLALTAAWVACGVVAFLGVGAIIDEDIHLAQVQRFAAGQWVQHAWLTTFPTWHLLVAAASWPWMDAQAEGAGLLPARLAATLFALAVLPAGYALVRAAGGDREDALRRCFMLALVPGVAPLMFLLYTDVFALAPVLAAAAAVQLRRPHAALAFATAATLLRQSHVVWVGWLALRGAAAVAGPVLRAAAPAAGRTPRRREPRAPARSRAGARPGRTPPATATPPRTLAAAVRVLPARLWPHALVLAGFALFVLANGGVAIGDRSHHPAGHLSLDNVHVALLYAWLVLLPVQLAALPRIAAGLRARSWTALPGLLLAAAFVVGFAPDHPYNRAAADVILHNGLIAWLEPPGVRLLAALPLLWSAWTLQFTPLREPFARTLLLAMLLSLLPVWMVEPRYALPALLLFLLLRAPERGRVEDLLAAWIAALGIALTAGYANGRFVL